MAYEVILLFTGLLAPYRFPIPYAVPIFDGPFAVVGIGVAYLCLERQRLRQDARSAWLGITLWITALLALAHIATHPDYPGTPGVPTGVAPYFFSLSYLGSFVGLGFAAYAGERPFPLTDRQRIFGAVAGVGFALLVVITVVNVQGHLPTLVMKPGRYTPFAIWVFALVNGAAALWALRGARRRLGNEEQDGFSRLFLAAGVIWVIGLFGVLTYPYRYSVPWYVAGLARPIGVGLIFVGLMREQVWLYRDARQRVRVLERLRNFGQALLQATSEREIVAAAAHTTRELVGADASGVYLADSEAATLRLEAGLGWDAGTVGVVSVPASEESFPGYAYLNREAVHVEDLETEDDFTVPAYLTAHGIRSGLVTPLGLAEPPLGVLAAFHRRPRFATDDERRLLASVADQTALALERARLYAELQASVVQLQETQAQLIQADKLKALGTLLSGMAHELNNPLSTIQLSVQILKRGDTSEAVRHRLGIVEEECERASRIIRDLLVFARRKSPERKPTDLNRVLNGVVTLQAPECDLHRIRIVTELERLPAIMADGHQLQQVFLNLCANATHAMKGRDAGGTLTIRSSRRDHEVVVQVEDTGPGIPAEHLGRIFDPFFTTKTAGEGTGLGLSLSIGIVQAHGGRMDATNLRRGGARFTIVLPLALEEDAPTDSPSEPAPKPERSGRVLVVDDEALLRQTVADVIATLGHSVAMAGTGREALALLEQEPFDVVTLDLRLPDIDGKTVWRQLLARDPALAARVIFLTGDTMSAETQTFLEEARRPVLTKPLTIDRISQLIDQILDESASPTPLRA